jgi:hypothetical protein
MSFFVFIDILVCNGKFNVCIYVCFILFPLLYYNYSFIYLCKGYASYIHISRGYVKHKRLRTTGLDNTRKFSSILTENTTSIRYKDQPANASPH